MKIVNWNKCGESGDWCNFEKLNLAHQHFEKMEGVYIIWHKGNPAKTVRVGQGVIKDRLAAHRQDNDVIKYSQYGMFVTWASVSSELRNGVELYLAKELFPLVGDRFPNVQPIKVNLPW